MTLLNILPIIEDTIDYKCKWYLIYCEFIFYNLPTFVPQKVAKFYACHKPLFSTSCIPCCSTFNHAEYPRRVGQ